MTPGYVYVIAFDSGGVKVGRTQNSKNRLRAHRFQAQSYGLALADTWVSPLHVEWKTNEDTLKALAAKHGGTPLSPEYFNGADYAALVADAATLPFTSLEDAEGGMNCLRNRRPARECAITTAALDAKVRMTGSGTQKDLWTGVKAGMSCRRCKAA